ncbi:MAG TPA: hypothetical protein VGV57_01535 [Thermoleophilaceae bacterium]|nr:hypothetical protein [Thermoleophilaceae bacterium]
MKFSVEVGPAQRAGGSRCALGAGQSPERLTDRQSAKLAEAQHASRGLYCPYLLKVELRALNRLDDRT